MTDIEDDFGFEILPPEREGGKLQLRIARRRQPIMTPDGECAICGGVVAGWQLDQQQGRRHPVCLDCDHIVRGKFYPTIPFADSVDVAHANAMLRHLEIEIDRRRRGRAAV